MSVFSAIKEKIVTVQQDLSNSIHLPFRSSKQDDISSASKNKSVALTTYLTFNANAGAELLAVYQRNWSEFHLFTEQNAQRAQELDGVVSSMFQKLDRDNTVLNEFLLESTLLDKLVEQLGLVGELVNDLEGSFKELETKLASLEDICDEMQQRKNTVEHEYQLNKYQQRKNIELEQAKVELARKHAAKVQNHDEQLSKTLRERQKVFEDAFREQMQNYKRVGRLERHSVAVQESSTIGVDRLSEIAVDDDTSLLDRFLDSPESTKNSEKALDVTEMLPLTSSALQIQQNLAAIENEEVQNLAAIENEEVQNLAAIENEEVQNLAAIEHEEVANLAAIENEEVELSPSSSTDLVASSNTSPNQPVTSCCETSNVP